MGNKRALNALKEKVRVLDWMIVEGHERVR